MKINFLVEEEDGIVICYVLTEISTILNNRGDQQPEISVFEGFTKTMSDRKMGPKSCCLKYCPVGCVIKFLSPNWFSSSIVHSVLNLDKSGTFNNVRCIFILQDAF